MQVQDPTKSLMEQYRFLKNLKYSNEEIQEKIDFDKVYERYKKDGFTEPEMKDMIDYGRAVDFSFDKKAKNFMRIFEDKKIDKDEEKFLEFSGKYGIKENMERGKSIMEMYHDYSPELDSYPKKEVKKAIDSINKGLKQQENIKTPTKPIAHGAKKSTTVRV